LVLVGGGAGSFFFALGGEGSDGFGATGVVTFSGLVAFSGDLAGFFVDCLLAGLGEEWILVGFTTRAPAASLSFFVAGLVAFEATTAFGVCLLGLAVGLAATAGFFDLGASCADLVLGSDFGSGLAFTAGFVLASVFLDAADLDMAGFFATAGDFLELLDGAGDFRFLLSVFFRAVDNVETPSQASKNIPPVGWRTDHRGLSSMVAERRISSDFEETLREVQWKGTFCWLTGSLPAGVRSCLLAVYDL
jgi:hypothetical protein